MDLNNEKVKAQETTRAFNAQHEARDVHPGQPFSCPDPQGF